MARAYHATKPKSGRPRLTAEQREQRGTAKPVRERAYGAAKAPAAAPELVQASRDYQAIAAGYAAQVLSGAIVACRWVRLAVERQEGDLRRAVLHPTWPFVWQPSAGAAACQFIEQCPHVEGRWASPLIVLEPWQVWLVMALFGWRHRVDLARRRFTILYVEVARKAAKSTLAAAIGLYHLTQEGEPGASVICGATTGLQARMVFGIMQKMVRKSAYLTGLGLTVYSNAITATDGSARPVNSKASTLDGLNPSCIILDESHAQDFGLHDVLKSAQGARRNPLMLCPTTAGYDLLSVGYALRSQLLKVLQGIFESDHLLGIVYTLDEDDDWRDAHVWIKANPMIGISPTVDYVRQYAQDAQQAKELEGEFRVKVCNQWAQSASTWLSITAWDKCADATLKIEDFLGQPCWIASDLAAVDDLAATALVFRKGEQVIGFVRAYLPEGVVAERARLVPAYEVWRRSGRLITTVGTMIDIDRIEADLRADCKRFQVRQLVFDQFGSLQIASRLSASGLPAVVEPKNARTFTAPMRELEARVKHGKFRHDGDLMLKWAVSNGVVTRRTDDSLLLKKEHAESANKIDPLDALIQAIGAMLRTVQKTERSFQVLILGGPRPQPAV